MPSHTPSPSTPRANHATAERLRLRTLRLLHPLRARLVRGVNWPLPDSREWRALTLVMQPADRPVDSGAPHFALATGRGSLRIASLAWLSVASGIALDADWPGPALADMARLATACLPAELLPVLGHACAWEDPPAECRVDRTTHAEFVLSLVTCDGAQHGVVATMRWAELAAWLEQPEWQVIATPGLRTGGACLDTDAAVALARLRLACSALRRLEAGDAVQLELPSHTLLAGWADFGAWRLHGHLQPGTLFFHHWERITMTHRIHNSDHETDTDYLDEADEFNEIGDTDAQGLPAIPPLDDLPVAVTVVAGRLRMNLLALRELQPGDVVALGGPALPQVELRAGGHLLARGELVDLDGRLAVEIVAVDALPDPDVAS